MPRIRGKEKRKRYERDKWRVVPVDPTNEKHVNMVVELSKIGERRGELLNSYAPDDIRDMANRGWVFLAYQGDKPIGYQITTKPRKKFVMESENGELDLSGYLYKHFVFVHPDYRGKGWGKRLMMKSINYLKKKAKARGVFFEVISKEGLNMADDLTNHGKLEKLTLTENVVSKIKKIMSGEVPEVEIHVNEGGHTYTYFVPLGLIYKKDFKK